MRYRRGCRENCSGPGESCPEYTPDFVALAKSYGAMGIRVSRVGEIKDALLQAEQNKKGPVLIEFLIEREANVMPIVPPGNALREMLLECRGRKA